jgi:hypothetical protein
MFRGPITTHQIKYIYWVLCNPDGNVVKGLKGSEAPSHSYMSCFILHLQDEEMNIFLYENMWSWILSVLCSGVPVPKGQWIFKRFKLKVVAKHCNVLIFHVPSPFWQSTRRPTGPWTSGPWTSGPWTTLALSGPWTGGPWTTLPRLGGPCTTLL